MLNLRDVSYLPLPPSVFVVLDMLVGVNHRNQDIFILGVGDVEALPRRLAEGQWLCSETKGLLNFF